MPWRAVSSRLVLLPHTESVFSEAGRQPPCVVRAQFLLYGSRGGLYRRREGAAAWLCARIKDRGCLFSLFYQHGGLIITCLTAEGISREESLSDFSPTHAVGPF